MPDTPQARPASWPEYVDASRLDEAGCVKDDAPCVHCEYNLRTLAANALCPECGKAVAESVRSPLLKYANREWVENRVMSGLSLLVAAFTTGLIGVGLIGLQAGATMLGPFGGGSEPFAIVGGMLVLLCGVMVMGFTITCTAREPGTLRPTDMWSAARVARGSLLGIVALVVLFVGALSFRTPRPALATAWLAAVLALAVLPLALLGHIAGIVRRIPDPELASRLEARARGLAACGLIGVTLVPIGMRLNSELLFFVVLIDAIVYCAIAIAICLCLRKADDEVGTAIGVDATTQDSSVQPTDGGEEQDTPP